MARTRQKARDSRGRSRYEEARRLQASPSRSSSTEAGDDDELDEGGGGGGGGGGGAGAEEAQSSPQSLEFAQSYVPLFLAPPVFEEDRDPEYLYGIVLLANRRLLKRCFQATVRYLDPQSVMKLRMVTREINREGERAMYRVWRYLVAVNLSSPFVTLPNVGGGGAGQMSFTEAVYRFFFCANKRRQEVLIIGGYPDGDGSQYGAKTNEVTKMIVELDGTIRFEASTPMLRGDCQSAVYHQGEVVSIHTDPRAYGARGTMERLDTLTQAQVQLQADLPFALHCAATAVLGNTLCVVGGSYTEPGLLGHRVDSDVMFVLHLHEHEHEYINRGELRAHEAKLIEARCCAAAAVCQGVLYVSGGLFGAGGSREVLRSVECFDPAIGTWQFDSYMTKDRASHTLFVFEDELYAVGGEAGGNATLEKRNNATKKWSRVAKSAGGKQDHRATPVLVGQWLFLLGGGFRTETTFDYYDMKRNTWASLDVGGPYFDQPPPIDDNDTKDTEEAAHHQQHQQSDSQKRRLLPRPIKQAEAVLITPPWTHTTRWTRLNVVKLEDRNTVRFDEQFEAVSGITKGQGSRNPWQ